MTIARPIRWSALTCRLRETDVYLGLAASLDDIVSDLISARHMVAFPLKQILLTLRDARPTPLRVYAVRDRRLVSVEPDGLAETEPGFRRVTLELHLDQVPLAGSTRMPSAAEAKQAAHESAADDAASRPVMAFLMTVGLPVAEEDEFFGTVVSDFITRSWMTFPSLLRGLGCSSASHVAEGSCDSCAT